MKSNSLPFILQALLAAIFFGASAPISKLLLGDIAPIFLAAFLYLGSGTGISLVKLTQRMRSKETEAGIKPPDIKWLAGAIISGGIAAPIILMISLQNTPASTASLLLLNTPPLVAEGLQAPWFIALEATDALAKA